MKTHTQKPEDKKSSSLLSPLTNGGNTDPSPAPCASLAWSTKITFHPIGEGRYLIAPSEFSVPTATRDTASVIRSMIEYCLENRVSTREVLQLVGRSSANVVTEFLPADPMLIKQEQQDVAAGMVMYFGLTIHDGKNTSVHEPQIQSLINSLPKDALEYASNEAFQFLHKHGYGNISKRMVLESGEVFLLLDGKFAKRPEPEISTIPLTYPDVRVRVLNYAKSKAIIASTAAGQMTVSVQGDQLLDKLHVAGKEETLLVCEVQEVLAAQNRKELKLLEVRLKPPQS